jgi:hydrogenase maturation protease
MPPKVLIAGVGNIFLGDDAFGVEVVKRLSEHGLPETVHIADFGIRSYDLAYTLMDDWDLVVLVDAVSRGGEPGTVYVIEADTSSQRKSAAGFDGHTMDPVSVLQMVNALGGKLKRMLVVGCEPQQIEFDESQSGLSPPVERAIDEAIRSINEIVSHASGDAAAA